MNSIKRDGADRWSLDNHSTVGNSLRDTWHPGMGEGLLAVKSGIILFIKSYQFSLQINTLERAFSKRNASYWTVRVLTLADFGCRWLSQLWRVTEPAAGYREPLWSWHRGIPWAVNLGLARHKASKARHTEEIGQSETHRGNRPVIRTEAIGFLGLPCFRPNKMRVYNATSRVLHLFVYDDENKTRSQVLMIHRSLLDFPSLVISLHLFSALSLSTPTSSYPTSCTHWYIDPCCTFHRLSSLCTCTAHHRYPLPHLPTPPLATAPLRPSGQSYSWDR